MCGITGFLNLYNQLGNNELKKVATQMANTIDYRGPDASGTWVDEQNGIALSHRRLSILDLSVEGYQPMVSKSKRFVIVFNGEIYNFQDIRSTLESKGHIFRGKSDTEVMLEAIEAWGIEKAVQSFVGMFAFALWDCRERLLYLGRDRLGEKPLYYGWIGKTFLFGSEIHSLGAHPHFKADIDRDAVALYVRYNYIPAPHSIYKGIYKLLPATILTINPLNGYSRPIPRHYWSTKDIVERGAGTPFSGSDSEATHQLDSLLRTAIKQQMIADVPLGAFLSGGIDSSTIVSLMQAQNNQPVHTFTIGYSEEAYNEAKHAKSIADYLGTHHTELFVTPQQALDVIPKLPTIYNEPFADASQIPTFLVSELARKKVTVSLSGDGGDELFGGYNRHIWGEKIWSKVGYLPQGLRKIGENCLKWIPAQALENSSFLPEKYKKLLLSEKIYKISTILAIDRPEAMYEPLISHWQKPENIVLGMSTLSTPLSKVEIPEHLATITEKMMYLDLIQYLPDDILVKVDRASMNVSLESRAPFLNHHVVEFAWSLPQSMKIRDGLSKWLLRQVLYQYVPKDLVERPKMGFGVPLDTWLRGPLREWAEDLLDKRHLIEDGFFNPDPIHHKWNEHLSGRHNRQHDIWNILMFQTWLKKDGR